MSWEKVLKARSYSSKNLPMLKQAIEKIYEDMPVGTTFKARDYWETFKKEVKLIIGTKGRKPIEFASWIRGKGEGWFISYFTPYGNRLGYIMPSKGEKNRWERV